MKEARDDRWQVLILPFEEPRKPCGLVGRRLLLAPSNLPKLGDKKDEKRNSTGSSS